MNKPDIKRLGTSVIHLIKIETLYTPTYNTNRHYDICIEHFKKTSYQINFYYITMYGTLLTALQSA